MGIFEIVPPWMKDGGLNSQAGTNRTRKPTYHSGLNFRINFFAEPSELNAAPYPITDPIGNFSSLEEARVHAFAAADNPSIMAHSFILESDNGVSERWVHLGS